MANTNNNAIFNMTQHTASAAQVQAGVVEPSASVKEEVRNLLTFVDIPSERDIFDCASALARLAVREGASCVMVGGAPYLMGPLVQALAACNIQALFAFSRRESVEETDPETGSVRKVAIFRHLGFAPALVARDQGGVPGW